MSKNVFGEKLEECSTEPMTGYYRDGCCNTDEKDAGRHSVCAIMTEEFLEFSKSRGNDLSTARPEWAFPGLKPGDRWCLCVLRWKEAFVAGKAPQVVLESTHEKALEHVALQDLISKAYKTSAH
ncbi:MAG: DUF2237 domain-containing protein [Cyclobacteriaceae bacterium]|nr:DUF2237 domain-containing protein [Cyclobacteriaceae bacterium]